MSVSKSPPSKTFPLTVFLFNKLLSWHTINVQHSLWMRTSCLILNLQYIETLYHRNKHKNVTLPMFVRSIISAYHCGADSAQWRVSIFMVVYHQMDLSPLGGIITPTPQGAAKHPTPGNPASCVNCHGSLLMSERPQLRNGKQQRWTEIYLQGESTV